MSKGIDLGTMFLVKSEIDDLVSQPTFTMERNVFLQAVSGEDTEDILKENNWSYVKIDNDFYILGEDAMKLKNLLTVNSKTDSEIVMTQVGELRRPMKDGLLNTSEEKLSIAIIQQIIKNLLGKPRKKDEVLCFCAPADPVDTQKNTLIFHRTMLSSFLSGLGYSVDCVPEALAIIFAERPVAEDPDEGEVPFSGIGISAGSGMANVVFAWKKMPLIAYSTSRGGDWIDKEAAKVAGVNVSAITRFKESKLDLNKIDLSDMRQAALSIYYENMIEYTIKTFAEKFNSLDTKIESPLEIVLAGGTASVPGFVDKFKQVISNIDLPFKVKEIRLADNPLYTVSKGCLVKAMSIENKKESKE